MTALLHSHEIRRDRRIITPLRCFCCCIAAILFVPASVAPAQTSAGGTVQASPLADAGLVGLWKAKRRFGHDERGMLILERTARGWTGDFLGRTFAVQEQDGVLGFSLPAAGGSFRARLNLTGGLSTGQWFQPPSAVEPAFGTNITFEPDGRGRWRGEIRPIDHQFTLYLIVERRSDGTLGAFIRNPERNIGFNLGVERLKHEGEGVQLIGRPFGRGEPRVVMSGTYDRDGDMIRLYFPDRGGSYDFSREGDDSDFWPRGRNPGRYL